MSKGRWSLTHLRNSYLKAFERSEQGCIVDAELVELQTEIMRRQHALLFRACCRVLRSQGGNFFAYCSAFAYAVTCDEVGPTSLGYEIPGFYTKDHHPYVVEFE